MKYSTIAVIATAIVPILLNSAEPSAFGAGDLDSSSPYGLTSTEKVILQNKEKLHTVVVKSKNQANEVDSLRERIDGIQSIIENLSRQAHNNKVTLKKLETQNDENLHNSDEYSKRLREVVQNNVDNFEESKVVISQLSMLVDKIDQDYVTKKEFNTLVESFNTFKTLVAKELRGAKSSQKSSDSIKSVMLYNRAKAMFEKEYYTKSIADYEVLISRKYKPAYAHYMIGEMNFKRKNYANAITYFKKSSSLYSKANYMSKLMLHTAISMNKTGDKEHAQAFFGAVISKYPQTKEALEAKKHLSL
jgi:TolA-binding protein